MKDKIIEIIVKYHSGRATVEDNKTLYNWLEESEKNKKYFDQISDIWFAVMSSCKKLEYDALSALKDVKSKINKEKNILFSTNIKSQQSKTRQIFNWLIRIAAVLIIVFSLGTTCYYLFSNILFGRSVNEPTTITAPLGSKS